MYDQSLLDRVKLFGRGRPDNVDLYDYYYKYSTDEIVTSDKLSGLKYNNYIHNHSTGATYYLPYPDTLNDSMAVSYTPVTILSRSAPVYVWTNSGPRTVSVEFNLHRDMDNDSVIIGLTKRQFTVNKFLDEIQSLSLPSYSNSGVITAPQISMRIGSKCFITGVLTSAPQVNYNKPLNKDGEYQQATVSLAISEVGAYDADIVRSVGNYRDPRGSGNTYIENVGENAIIKERLK